MNQTPLAVVVLAAGQGTRMKSSTPKLLHRLGGVPMLSHVLGTVKQLGATHIAVVVRFERDQIAALVADEAPDCIIVDQDETPGTGRALQQAVAALPKNFTGDIVVVNGDVPLLDANIMADLIDHHRTAGVAATVLSTSVSNPEGYGRIVRDPDLALVRIIEHKDAKDSVDSATLLAVKEINAGVYVFARSKLDGPLGNLTAQNAQGELYVTDVLGHLRDSDSAIQVHQIDESWRVEGVNDRIQLATAAHRLNQQIIQRWQRAGVTVQDPGSTWIDSAVTLAQDVTILPNTQLYRATTIGEGSTIGPDTTITDCEIGAHVTVMRSDATLAVFGNDTSVGPFAFVRPGTVLANSAKIGTFVETKNAHIGEGSKVAHFNYVGDATVGEGSNIGAGAIVANYDGVNKHHTEIGSFVRIASHTVMVAPVSIGDGAYTGAGAVVRKDVPPGALAVTVAPQRNLQGWVEKNRPGTPAAQAAVRDATDE